MLYESNGIGSDSHWAIELADKGSAKMSFDFVDLKLFVNISGTNNLTRAAERSNLSLSAASSRIRNLEFSVGSKLIYRHNLGVTLTPQGITFLGHARQLLQQSELLHGDMQKYSMGVKGHIRVSANSNASSTFLPDVLRRYMRKNPHISIDLEERISSVVIDAVSNGVADIGIISGGQHTGKLEVIEYHPDPIVVATSLHHPLASRSVLAFEDTLEYDFVGVPGARVIDALLRRDDAGTNRCMQIRVKGDTYETACRMIEADIGIGVLPASTAERHARAMAIKVISLSNEWAAINLRICARSFKLLPKFARDLVDIMASDTQCQNDALPQRAS
jgi:DNA-binding transcriptional LysR family regulator